MSSPASKRHERAAAAIPMRRLAYASAILSGLLTPIHEYVSRATSELLAMSAAALVPNCALLCLREPFPGSGRFRPLFYTLAAFLLHSFMVC